MKIHNGILAKGLFRATIAGGFAIMIGLSSLSCAAAVNKKQADTYWLSQYQAVDEAGTTILLVRDGKILRQETLGMANLELGVKLQADHRFRIGSITKMFVAVLALQLADEGKLELEKPIRHYLPDLPQAWQAITVAHLLSHTSGIPDYLGGPQGGYSALRGKRLSQDEMIKLFFAWPLQFKPGERFIYSNSGYVVLSKLVETISQRSFSTLLEQRITTPLDMRNTFAKLEDSIIPGMVTGYTNGNQATFITKLDAAFPDGSMISTSADLAKFAQALLDGRLLNHTSFEKMRTPFIFNSGEKSEYGFGAFFRHSQGHALVGHGGDIFGFHAMLEFDMDSRAIAIVLRNSDQFGARRLTPADHLSRRLLAEVSDQNTERN